MLEVASSDFSEEFTPREELGQSDDE